MIFSSIVRRLLLFILVLGLAGTGAELLLLQHFQDGWQLVPLVVIALAIVALIWHALAQDAASVRAIRIVMALSVVSGALGVLMHYSGNAEFEREMSPSIAGFELFSRSMMGATPALAPGTMTLLGLIGLLYTYRHPRLGAAAATQTGRDEWDA